MSAGMLPLLLLLLDRQVAQLCKEEPPAQAGGFLFRTAMLRNRFPESPPASREEMADMFTRPKVFGDRDLWALATILGRKTEQGESSII